MQDLGFLVQATRVTVAGRHTLTLPMPCRKGFPAVVRILDDTIANMAALAPGSELDINNVTMRLAMDITGEPPFTLLRGTPGLLDTCFDSRSHIGWLAMQRILLSER